MKKKILILLYHLDQGGVEKTAVNLANELVEKGHDVTLKTIYKHYPEKFDIDSRVIVKNMFGFYFKGLDRVVKLISPKLLYKLAKENDADIEVAFQADLPSAIIGSNKNDTIKKYGWMHGNNLPFTKYYKNFNSLFFVGEELMEVYVDDIKSIPNVETKVFYNAMDTSHIIAKS